MLLQLATNVSSIPMPANHEVVDNLSYVTKAVNDFVTTHGDVFVTVASHWLHNFAVFALFLVAIRHLFGLAPLKQSLAEFGFTWLFCFFLLTFYNNPLPWSPYNLHQLVTEECRYLSSFLDISVMNDVLARIHDIVDETKRPSVWNPLELVLYIELIGEMWLLEAFMFCLTASSFIFTGILIVVGSLFIPALMFRQTAPFFWKILAAFLATSFLRVTASAFIFVYCEFALAMFDHVFTGTFSAAHFLRLGGGLLAMVFAFLGGAFAVVKFNMAIFSGVSATGYSAFGLILSVIRSVV